MNNLDRISKIKPLINKYNWKGINYPSGKDDWKKFEESNVTVTFNVFYVKKNEYISYLHFKANLKSRKTNHSFNDSKRKRNHCSKNLAVKILSDLLRGIKSKKVADFYCLACLHLFRTKNKLESHKKVRENKDFCDALIF